MAADDGGRGKTRSFAFKPLRLEDPDEIAGFRLAARLGSGGMGTVYLSHMPDGQPTALKVIRQELAEGPDFRRQFEREIAAARRVQGPFTMPVLESDSEGPVPWLATGYVAGPSLGEAVSIHGQLPDRMAVQLMSGVAEALATIHAAGVVHRDLKPSNVLLATDGPRVIDFGIARAADATTRTASDRRVGTPGFMAPEQVRGEEVTAQADMFALGLLICFAATGRGAFGRGEPDALLYRIVHDEPDLSRCPAGLREIVAACLAKDPAARPGPAQVLEACRVLSGGHSPRPAEGWLEGSSLAVETAQRVAPPPAAPGGAAAGSESAEADGEDGQAPEWMTGAGQTGGGAGAPYRGGFGPVIIRGGSAAGPEGDAQHPSTPTTLAGRAAAGAGAAGAGAGALAAGGAAASDSASGQGPDTSPPGPGPASIPPSPPSTPPPGTAPAPAPAPGESAAGPPPASPPAGPGSPGDSAPGGTPPMPVSGSGTGPAPGSEPATPASADSGESTPTSGSGNWLEQQLAAQQTAAHPPREHRRGRAAAGAALAVVLIAAMVGGGGYAFGLLGGGGKDEQRDLSDLASNTPALPEEDEGHAPFEPKEDEGPGEAEESLSPVEPDEDEDEKKDKDKGKDKDEDADEQGGNDAPAPVTTQPNPAPSQSTSQPPSTSAPRPTPTRTSSPSPTRTATPRPPAPGKPGRDNCKHTSDRSGIWRNGSSGTHVRQIQCLLNHNYNHRLDVDGMFGPKTAAAVRSVQSCSGAAVDGEVGPVTWGYLDKPKPACGN